MALAIEELAAAEAAARSSEASAAAAAAAEAAAALVRGSSGDSTTEAVLPAAGRAVGREDLRAATARVAAVTRRRLVPPLPLSLYTAWVHGSML